MCVPWLELDLLSPQIALHCAMGVPQRPTREMLQMKCFLHQTKKEVRNKGSCPALCGGCVTGATFESPSVANAGDLSEAMTACAEADPIDCEGIDASACTMPEVAESIIAMCPSLCGACGGHTGGGGGSSRTRDHVWQAGRVAGICH